MNAMTLRLRRRLTNGVAMGGTYTLSKSIDDASSMWRAAAGPSRRTIRISARSADCRASISAIVSTRDFTYELPFGDEEEVVRLRGMAGRHLRQLAVQRQRAAGVGHAVHRAHPRRRRRRGQGVNGTLRANYNGAADLAQRSDDDAVLQQVGVLAARARDVRQRRPEHDHRPGNRRAEPGPDQEHHVQPTRGLSIQVLANNVLNTVQFASIDTVRQFADLRPGDRRARSMRRVSDSDEVQVLRLTGRSTAKHAERWTSGSCVLCARSLLWCCRRAVAASPRAQAPAQPQPVFRSGTELVLVNVVVRDKSGAVVRGLTQDDFIVSEDDKPQPITSFDFEELDKADAVRRARRPTIVLPKQDTAARRRDAARGTGRTGAGKVDMHGRRLIVLFFDLSSMQPEELTARGEGGARLRRHEAVARRSHRRRLVLDIAEGRSGFHRRPRSARLERSIRTAASTAQGFEDGGNGDADGHAGQRQRVHRRRHRVQHLQHRPSPRRAAVAVRSALRHRAEEVGHLLQQRHEPAGHDNQVELRRTVDRANRANVSIYAADMRGLQAMVPGGDASPGQHAAASRRSPARPRAISSAACRPPRTR